jgi:hypothetical protein
MATGRKAAINTHMRCLGLELSQRDRGLEIRFEDLHDFEARVHYIVTVVHIYFDGKIEFSIFCSDSRTLNFIRHSRKLILIDPQSGTIWCQKS